MAGKAKSSLELMKEIRNTWTMNPRTRIQENELKNKKKRRAEDRKLEKGEW
jgi:hypothetical protein